MAVVNFYKAAAAMQLVSRQIIVSQGQPMFDAGKWIVDNCRGGYVLTSEAIQSVTSFTLMWNLFENVLCGSEANVQNLDRAASDTLKHGDIPDQINVALLFWRNRYLAGGQFNHRFDTLHLRPGDRRQLIETVLSGNVLGDHSKMLAALIIVYRLRNNLFHGLKEIGELNDQVENLDTASRVLAATLLISGKLP